MEVNEIIRRFSEDENDRLLMKRIVEKAQSAEKHGLPASTRFLSDRELAMAQKVVNAAGFTYFAVCGGFDQPERAVLLFLPEWKAEAAPEDDPVSLIHASYFKEYELSHRDFLGALIGAGIARDTVGDIKVYPGGADMAVLREIAPFLLSSLDKAGRAPLKLEVIEKERLRKSEAEYILIKDTVASLRLDSVLSTGLKTSREKATALIRQKRVQLDHADCDKPDKPVSVGALISVKGFGRMELTEVGGLTRKGRLPIVVKKFV